MKHANVNKVVRTIINNRIMSPETVYFCDLILAAEGLEHLIGHVQYTLASGQLLVFPANRYARRYIGAGEFLSFQV